MARQLSLLLADDEAAITDNLAPFLERSGFLVRVAADGAAALAQVQESSPDLIILDVLMPRLDGRAVLRQLRQQGDWTPVILLTQVGEAFERAMALEEGADDYLNKPFDPLELVARVQAVLRRTQRGNLPLSSFRYLVSNGLSLDRQMRQVKLNGELLNLTTRAVGVIEFLMLHPHEVVSRERLLDEVWGWSDALETRAVDIRIAEIRKVLEKDTGQPKFIETVIGTGYRFLADVQGQP